MNEDRHHAKRITTQDLTIDQENSVAAPGPAEELRPPRDPPAACHTRKIVLTIGGKRYELAILTEVREITRGPAKLIEMPSRPTIEP
jgi:hypothetical protein